MTSWQGSHYKKWSPEEKEYLVTHYKDILSGKLLALKMDRSPSAIRRQAQVMGLTSKRSRAIWSPEEKELLSEWAESKPLAKLTIAWNKIAKYNKWPCRSYAALSYMIEQLGYSREVSLGYYKVPALCLGLGVSRRAVLNWLKSKKLKAERFSESDHSRYLVKESDLVEFAFCYPAEISERITPDGCCWLLQIISQSRSTPPEEPIEYHDEEPQLPGSCRAVKRLDTGREFNSIKEASAACSVTPGAICGAIRSRHRCDNSYWQYVAKVDLEANLG